MVVGSTHIYSTLAWKLQIYKDYKTYYYTDKDKDT